MGCYYSRRPDAELSLNALVAETVGLQVSFLVQVMISKPGIRERSGRDESANHHHMNSKLYVGNLSFKTTEDDLRETFSQFGTVTDVYVANDRETGRPRGFGFITMSSAEEGQKAIDALHGQNHDGRDLTVNEAKPMEPRGGGRSGGGGGGQRREYSGGSGGGGNRNRY